MSTAEVFLLTKYISNFTDNAYILKWTDVEAKPSKILKNSNEIYFIFSSFSWSCLLILSIPSRLLSISNELAHISCEDLVADLIRTISIPWMETLTLWTSNYFCQTPVGTRYIFSMLLLSAELIFANLPPGAGLFWRPKNVTTLREL